MVEEIVAKLTGSLPEPCLDEVPDTLMAFDIGTGLETIEVEFVATYNEKREKLFDIGKKMECRFGKILLRDREIGDKGYRIEVPKELVQEFGIGMDHYLYVRLLEVIKGGERKKVFPKRKVIKHFPEGFEEILKKGE